MGKPRKTSETLGAGLALCLRANLRRFEDSRAFVHALGLKSHGDWVEYCKSGKKPEDIPSAPRVVYAETGWAGMGDWLGTGTISTRLRKYRPFEKARAFVHALGLKSQYDWAEYCKSGKKPDDIPATPYRTYTETGWAGWGDWLGTGRVYRREYRTFTEARAFVHALGLKSHGDWRDYYKSGKKPDDIPANPGRTYAETGWAGMGDWLGTGRVAPRLHQYRPFNEARAFVHALGLKSETDWRDYCRSGKKPEDIPSAPRVVYAETGWAGMGDWFGTGTVATFRREFRPFAEARGFVHGLGLKSWQEWFDYCKSGNKPNDIPSNPNQVYAAKGWAGLGDWLGTARKRSFQSSPIVIDQVPPGITGLAAEAVRAPHPPSRPLPDDVES
jgi:Phage-integrase repeat unit